MKVNFENIYEHIGYLFFGLARGNGSLSTAHFVELTDLIEGIWRPVTQSDPSLHLHLVDCIHAGISYAEENGFSAEHALSTFTDYYQIYSLAFSKPLKEKIVATTALIIKGFPPSQQNELNRIDVEKLIGMKSVA